MRRKEGKRKLKIDMQDIYSKITGILRDVFDDDDLVATEKLSASDVPGWDSLAHVRFMLAIERAFSIAFSASEISSFKNVGDLAKAISAKSH